MHGGFQAHTAVAVAAVRKHIQHSLRVLTAVDYRLYSSASSATAALL